MTGHYVGATPVESESVTAVVRLAGTFPTRVTVQHPSTPEAALTMAIGRAVIYLHTRDAARQMSELADRAAAYAIRLPTAVPLRRPQAPHVTNDAQASIIVHTNGAPGGILHIRRLSDATFLHLQIGELVFHLQDRIAADLCLSALSRAGSLGHKLPRLDDRRGPRSKAVAPTLDGADADRARGELSRPPHEDAIPAIALQRAQAALAHAQRALSALSTTPGPLSASPDAEPHERRPHVDSAGARRRPTPALSVQKGPTR